MKRVKQMLVRCGRLGAAMMIIAVLGLLSVQIGAWGATLFASAPPKDDAALAGFDELTRAPARTELAVTAEPVPAYTVPRYTPITEVRSLQYRMNRVLIREESWRARSAPWEIIDYYARHFAAGLWDDVTDEQFGLTRNEADPTCPSHSESFDEWAERYHRVRNHHLAVRRGGRSVRVSVEPGARGLATVRVVWAETPDLKGYLNTLAHGMKDDAMGGEARWTVGEDCDDCPEPGMEMVRFAGDKADAHDRIAGQLADEGWTRRMDLGAHPNGGDVAVWGRDRQVRMVSLSETPRGAGTDALILTVRE